jgi:hypothetical protein
VRGVVASLVFLGAVSALQVPSALAQDNPFDSPDLKSALNDKRFTDALSGEHADVLSEFLADDVKIRGFREFLKPEGNSRTGVEVLDKHAFLAAFSSELAGPRHLCFPRSQGQGNLVAAVVRDTTEVGFGCNSGRAEIVTWEWSGNKVKWMSFAQQPLITEAGPRPEAGAKVKRP